MKKVTLTYFDGSSAERIVDDKEIPFPEGKLIVSRTDKQGLITHCNQAFIEMSGYSEQELIGQPQHILRHPDMPAAAFTDLWQTVDNGEKWSGYVKNLTKNGSYYWVYAVVVPNIRNGAVVGYASVRRKPSRDKVNECIKVYQAMKKDEEVIA